MVVGNSLLNVHLFISKCAERTYAKQELCFLKIKMNINKIENLPQLCSLGFCRLPDSALLQNWRYKKAYGTRCSQAVPHPSTILARRCLTSVIRRERVCSSWYGRRQRADVSTQIYSRLTHWRPWIPLLKMTWTSISHINLQMVVKLPKMTLESSFKK